MTVPVLFWFRRDLRLRDNPGLAAAQASGAPILPVYIHDDALEPRPLGRAARHWLALSLHVLDEDLQAMGSRLIVLTGDANVILPSLCDQYGINTVYCSHIYNPVSEDYDQQIAHDLTAVGVRLHSDSGQLLAPPWRLKTQEGKSFKVFTPFLNRLRGAGLLHVDHLPLSDGTGTWADLPNLTELARSSEDALSCPARFTPGEKGARQALDRFLTDGLKLYAVDRDRPDREATSYLSPHLRFGEISVQRVLFELDKAIMTPADTGNADKFRSELAWREFCYGLLWQQPLLHQVNFRDGFDRFPWRNDDVAFDAWRRGETGYDLVDAGMRELAQTGYMHNRVRMVCASFLVKHLLIDWRRGEQWFWECLFDADPANNPANWQWVAGCGADAAPYFRIFNPISQAAKFDPEGRYRALYLGGDMDSYRKADKAGRPNADPCRRPLVEHAAARQRALDAYQARGDEDEPD